MLCVKQIICHSRSKLSIAPKLNTDNYLDSLYQTHKFAAQFG